MSVISMMKAISTIASVCETDPKFVLQVLLFAEAEKLAAVKDMNDAILLFSETQVKLQKEIFAEMIAEGEDIPPVDFSVLIEMKHSSEAAKEQDQGKAADATQALLGRAMRSGPLH